MLVEADGELTSRELRIPLARIVADFADAASKPATHSRLFGELLGIDFRLTGKVPPKIPGLWQDLLPVTTKERPIPRVRPGRRGHSDAFYRQVAKDYRRVKRERPRAPIRALMKELLREPKRPSTGG